MRLFRLKQEQKIGNKTELVYIISFAFLACLKFVTLWDLFVHFLSSFKVTPHIAFYKKRIAPLQSSDGTFTNSIIENQILFIPTEINHEDSN